MKILSVYSGVSPLVVSGLKSRFLIDKRMRPSFRLDYYDSLETRSGIVSRVPAESPCIHDRRNYGGGGGRRERRK